MKTNNKEKTTDLAEFWAGVLIFTFITVVLLVAVFLLDKPIMIAICVPLLIVTAIFAIYKFFRPSYYVKSQRDIDENISVYKLENGYKHFILNETKKYWQVIEGRKISKKYSFDTIEKYDYQNKNSYHKIVVQTSNDNKFFILDCDDDTAIDIVKFLDEYKKQ